MSEHTGWKLTAMAAGAAVMTIAGITYFSSGETPAPSSSADTAASIPLPAVAEPADQPQPFPMPAASGGGAELKTKAAAPAPGLRLRRTGDLMAAFKRSYDDLHDAAARGDAEAAWALYLRMQQCDRLPATDEGFEQRIEQIRTTKTIDPGGTRYIGDEGAEQMVERMNESRAFCTAIPADQRKAGQQWLDAAIAGGNVSAQGNYLFQEWQKRRADGESLTLESMAAKTQEIVQSLDQRARSGNAEALMTMGMSYNQGDMVPKDRVRAYAYFSASGAIMEQAYGPPPPGAPDWLGQMASGLSPYELDQAEALKQEVLSSPECCEAPQMPRGPRGRRNGWPRG